MRRLIALVVVCVAAGSLGACGKRSDLPRAGSGSTRDRLVDVFAKPLWGDVKTVRYRIDEPPWGSIEGVADLAAGRYAVTGTGDRADGEAGAFEAYVEGKHWWERSRTVDGASWLQHDLLLDSAPLVTPQLPLLVPSDGPEQARYVVDGRVRRQVVEALMVGVKKIDNRRVRGVSTNGYRVHLSGAAAARILPAALAAELVSFGDNDIDATFDVWLDEAGTVRRVVMPGLVAAKPWAIELWDQGAPVTVTRPADLARRPEDLRPPVDPPGRTELAVSTGPRLGHPEGDRRMITTRGPGVEFSANIIKKGGGASELDLRVLSRPTNGVALGWTITVATVGAVRQGVYPLGDRFDWTPKGPVGGIDADEALVTARCTGRVEVRELALDAHGRPNRVWMVFSARCPSDGRDATRQFATSVSGEVRFHSLTG